MTIMTQGGGDGARARTCNETCHRARRPACRCICGGKYHGVGSSEKAQAMLTDDWLGADWREKYAGKTPSEIAAVVRAAREDQGP